MENTRLCNVMLIALSFTMYIVDTFYFNTRWVGNKPNKLKLCYDLNSMYYIPIGTRNEVPIISIMETLCFITFN